MDLHPLFGSVKDGVIRGLIGGGETPGTKVAKTQAEVNAANMLAKRLMIKNNQTGITNPIAVSKVGDRLPQFVDPAGRPYVGTPNKQLPTTVPDYVTLSDIKSDQGGYYYVDPKTGDNVDVDPVVVSLPRFRKQKEQLEADAANRLKLIAKVK